MNRQRFSTIAHGDLPFANPLNSGTVDHALTLLDLLPGNHVLDVGCGNAELLIRLIERSDIIGIGVDTNEASLAEARRRAGSRISAGRLTLHHRSITDFQSAPHSFDAAMCVGSTHAYGDFVSTLRALADLVRPGGELLIGEGYWKRPPAALYLEHLEATEEEMTTHAGNIARAEALGLEIVHAAESSDDDWDEYEGAYSRNMERYAAEHPDDPDRDAFLAHSRKWYAGYRRWGRDTLGFGLYLFRTGSESL